MEKNNTPDFADNLNIASHSPHVKTRRSVRFIMLNVCIALLPSAIVGVVFFGLYALAILTLSVFSAAASEIVFLLITKVPLKVALKKFDFTSVVTGLLIGMCLGVNYPWYAPVFGSVFAVIVVKMLFGGTGKNLVNPAICGRIFIFISFQAFITPWVLPLGGGVVTGATVLAESLENSALPTIGNLQLFLGIDLAGCIGETCKLALLVGAAYLAVMRIIDIKYPVICTAAAGLTAVAFHGLNFAYFLPSILSGGLIIGVFFMATDYVTTPNTTLGNLLYFTFLGVLITLLRVATGMETVSFAILLMNLTVPLIDKYILPRPFGKLKDKKIKVKEKVS